MILVRFGAVISFCPLIVDFKTHGHQHTFFDDLPHERKELLACDRRILEH